MTGELYRKAAGAATTIENRVPGPPGITGRLSPACNSFAGAAPGKWRAAVRCFHAQEPLRASTGRIRVLRFQKPGRHRVSSCFESKTSQQVDHSSCQAPEHEFARAA